MSLDLGTLFGFIGVVLAIVGGYAAIRDIIDKRDKNQATQLDAQTKLLSNKLDKVQEGVTAACISAARVETTVTHLTARVSKIEEVIFVPNPEARRYNHET